jgi:alpha-tubulin suppressor-like RCC1 family protein
VAILLIVAVASLASVCVNGAPVSSTDGERAAQAFLYSEASRSSAYRAAVGIPEGVRVKGATELRDPESADLLGYVFALDPSGYLVVPAETRLVPVIAYSYAGEFPWEESEENILLSMLRLDLRWRNRALAEKGGAQSIPDSNEALWRAYLEADGAAAVGDSPTVYGPQLTTEWHQFSPYSDLCPWDSVHGSRSVVGCTATALAQILNYWRFPTEIAFQATDDYTTTTHGFAINAGAASFARLDYGAGELSDADKARLSYAAGVSVRMDYCSNGSGAWVEDVCGALAGAVRLYPGIGVPERWGYESANVRSYGSSHSGWGSPYYVTEEEFFSQLANDMVAARPAEMAIVPISGVGHAIVVDGWQSGGRVYHLNFGWGGDSSGWYSLPEGIPAGLTVIDCAVLNIRPTTPGGIYAFGFNGHGGLGLGDTTARHTPTKITTLPGPATAVAAGTYHSLVLLENGNVYAFGWNGDGELGLGDTIDRWTPTKITTLPGPATAVAVGCTHSLILLQNGDVYAFGHNQDGQLGLGDTAKRLAPTKITTLPGPARGVVTGGYHSLVLLENGDVYAFGHNAFGCLGLGDTTKRLAPTKITTLPGPASAVAAGGNRSFVLLQNGDVYSCGMSDSFGSLGLGDTVDRWTPTKITTLPGPATAVAAGTYHSLVLLENGDVYAFGWNRCGALGLGDTVDRWAPTKITTLPGPATAAAAGTDHSLVLLENGDVYAFGLNQDGQLGLGDTAQRLTPMKITTHAGAATALAAGSGHYSLVICEGTAGLKPATPSGTSATDGAYADKVHVTWSAVIGAASYPVHRATSPSETFIQIGEATGTSYDDSGIAAGQVYWYKVTACNGSDCSDLSAADSGYAGTAVSGASAAFRVTSFGDVRADGGFYAGALFLGSADVAEWVLVSEAVEAGTVLELDTSRPGSYRSSQSSCSSLVAGVVSSQPGMVLGGAGSTDGMALLALSGIVPVKVTNEGGPIQPGDLLVSSSTPGFAMRWSGSDPCPCALVGKAVEPMTDESGVISVLLTAH